MRWLFAACGSAFVLCAVAAGAYHPLVQGDSVSYRFVAPRLLTVAAAWLPLCAALFAGFLFVHRYARTHPPTSTDALTGRWMSPLAALGFIALGVAPAMLSGGAHYSVLVYFFFDLRWWWIAVLVGLTIGRADRAIGDPVRSRLRGFSGWSAASRLLALDAGLFVVVVGWAVVTSPTMRFDSGLHGDEPKYIRMCEAWYQGAGLDIERATTVATQSLATPPALLTNFANALAVVPETFHDFSRDLGDSLRDPTHFRWNRVRSANGFIRGKHGGIYQVHAPGVSAVLMPGYVIDRYLLTADASPDGKFPNGLVMTNVMMLLVYALAAVALFRLLRHALGSDALAWVWAALGMLTMPTTAFAFQFYPEVPALLIVIGVTNYVLFSSRSSVLSALCAGAAIGALDWCHPRFLFVAACLLVTGAIRLSGPRRRMLLASAATVLLSAMAFDFHVTGSWLPTARWDATGDGVHADVGDVAMNLIAYGFDRVWGLLPHNLMLVAALPGLALLFRISRAHAVFIVVIIAALLVPAAAHSLSAGGTTPGRFVVAVIPLLTWPIAVIVRRGWSSPAIRATTMVVVTVSLSSALAYNAHHFKSFATMADASVSGWALNLAFPVIRGDAWPASAANVALFMVDAVVILVLAGVAVWKAHATTRPATTTRIWHIALAVSAAVMICSLGTAANQDWMSRDYQAKTAVAANPPR